MFTNGKRVTYTKTTDILVYIYLFFSLKRLVNSLEESRYNDITIWRSLKTVLIVSK